MTRSSIIASALLLCSAIALCADSKVSAGYNHNFAIGTSGPWVDSMVPALAIVPGATAPVRATFVGGGLEVYGFNSNQDDEALFTLQLNHDYKEGSSIEPHVHWSPATAPSGTATNIVWGLEYTVKEIGGTFAAPTTIYVTNDITGYVQWRHYIASLPTIAGTGLKISSVMVGRVFRPSNTREGATRYDADAMFLGFDVHYATDAMGSTTSTTK